MSSAAAPSSGAASLAGKNETHDSKNINSRATDIRLANIANAKAIAELVRTSLGPRGMDKMIQMPDGEVLFKNTSIPIPIPLPCSGAHYQRRRHDHAAFASRPSRREDAC
jgi:chaperonin GroEL (HSP60 family)